MIVAWPLAINPSDNYLECNGQAIDSKKYPKLYKLMKNTPDYKGVFLRGLGSITSTHYGTVNHASANLNELQGDAIRNITGNFNTSVRILANKYATGVFEIGQDIDLGDGSEGNYGETFQIELNASRVIPTANENRPINKAVRYFIKGK